MVYAIAPKAPIGDDVHDDSYHPEQRVRELIDERDELLANASEVEYRDTEQDGEEQHLQDVACRERVHDRRRDDVHQEVDGRQMRGARGVSGNALRIELCRVRMHARTRLHHVDEDEADDQRDRRDDLKVNQRPKADTANLLHVAHLGDADDHGAEDDGGDHHANQLHEGVAERPHGGAEARVQLPQHHADDDADDDLKPEAGIQRLLSDGGSSGHGSGLQKDSEVYSRETNRSASS
jgi:hypothetical protein